MTKATVSGSIYAEVDIFSPIGYAYKVFGKDSEVCVKSVKGKKMEFVFPSVKVTGTDLDATLIENITSEMETEYLGNIYWTVTYED